MIDESQIEYLLNGERAEADVLNRPLRQLVRATNASLSEVDNAALLIEKRYDDVFEVTRDGNGFTREKDARLIFDASNATVSIAPGLGKSTWFYYHRGRKIESSETLTYTLSETDKTDGGFYLSFDKDRNFVNTGPYPDFYNTTLCFYVHYSNGEFIIEGDERHSADRDTAWHHSHHREDGMVVYTLGNIDWTPDDANKVGIQITTTLVADEDLQHLIKHSPTGEEPFNQILEGSQDTVRIPTLYYDGDIRYLADKKLPWVVDALKYNDGVTLKDVPDGKFVNYFLVATHCQKYPIKLIMGRMLFDSDHETVDETLESLGLNFPEMALLYRISLERDNSLSTVGKCKLKSVQQAASRITFESTAGSGGSSLSNHAQLLGRTEDNAHPISAITGLQEELDNKVDKVSGKELSTNDFTNVLKTKLVSLPSGVSGVIPISGGGTGATTAPAARTALGLGTAATSNIVQEAGQSTNSVMSQKVVSDNILLLSLTSFGNHQTWKNVTGTRALNTTYTNHGFRPIMVSVLCIGDTGHESTRFYIDNVLVGINNDITHTLPNGTIGLVDSPLVYVVPPNSTYRVASTGGITIWSELS